MTTRTQTVSNPLNRFRTGLILGGIVVAIVVFPFLMRDTSVDTGFSILPHFTPTTKQIINLGSEKLTAVVASIFN